MMDWFSMGGYAIYIWPSYLLGFIVMFLNIWIPLRKHRTLAAQYTVQDEVSKK